MTQGKSQTPGARDFESRNGMGETHDAGRTTGPGNLDDKNISTQLMYVRSQDYDGLRQGRDIN